MSIPVSVSTRFEDNLDEASSSVLEDVVSGLIQSTMDAPGIYSPKLIANRPGNTMCDAISEELASSESFDISVAFVSPRAIRTLFEAFKSRAQSQSNIGRTNRLITSTKNYFNAPSAFWELLRLKNTADVDVRVWAETPQGHGGRPGGGQPFHPKGYVFARRMENGKPYYNLYVGSSNLTQQALDRQREWNLRVSSLREGDLVEQFREELDSQIADSIPLTEDWIKQYEEDFKKYAPPRREILESLEHTKITPNAMQQEALANLAQLRQQGEHRAIIISATGTGKTYLSAFDVQAVKPKRMLYIVHQQQILTSAMKSYRKVLHCDPQEMGLFTGDSKQSDHRYVFATIQTLSKPEILSQFESDEFDYILIDEAHHVGADSYRRVIEHFNDADFILGMTATPERTDGINIFELFGHNIAYEIRLQRALDENMLCPFHYYGVAEYLGADDDAHQSQQIDVRRGMSDAEAKQLDYEISQLATSERVRYIIDKLQQYSPYHQQVTGLVFCSRQDEAEELSRLFNQEYNQQAERTYRTAAITSKTHPKQSDREAMVKRLEEGEFDYLFTVDLFNEGIDIPAVNQIVMLRNTQSSIVFTQQLGRGLRKFPHKDSVIVIDFIGNYANNYLIPVALYGNTGDRDMARKNLQRRTIGLSSISFDPIAKERVLKSLDAADWSDMKKLTEQYRQLRFQLGRIPMLADVYKHDPSLPFTLASKTGSYLDFVVSREQSLSRSNRNTDEPSFLAQLEPVNDMEKGILKMATELLVPGLRPHELVILSRLCQFREERIGDSADARKDDWNPSGSLSLAELSDDIASQFPNAYLNPTQIDSAIHTLDFSYFIAANHKRFGATPLIERSDDGQCVRLSPVFADALAHNRTFRIFFADALRCGLVNCHDLFDRAKNQQRDPDRGFLYEQKYTLADVVRLLGWRKEMNGQNVGGYFCHRDTGTMPIFVKYAASQYEDKFLGPQDMRYYSKNGRTPNSPEFQWMSDGRNTPDWHNTHFIPLFVMRKEEAKEARYYYVGHVTSFGDLTLTSKPDNDGAKTVKVTVTNLHLAKPLDAELYRHLTGGKSS